MTEATRKHWGMTPALSENLPDQSDITRNADLIEELKRENNYEGQAETQRRIETLRLLHRVTVEFVREVSRRQNFPQSQIDQFGGKVYPYGSYRLGVYGPGSDIDTLAVAPRHVQKNHFFEYFPPTLKRMVSEGAVSSMTPVPDAYVPIIKLVLNNIEIDLIFVSISTLQTIPKDLELKDNKLLEGLEASSIRAITGPRVTDEILSLIPEPKTFRTALRAIKLWAQRRAIYANIVGFPGGVAWAMLVARVCQLYPKANGAMIVNRFFFVMKGWKWPTPILLKEIETGKEKTWNPKLYRSDKQNIMPIITPAYPSMCATYNISTSGKTVIQHEIERAEKITEGVFHGNMQWKDLFKKHTFFTTDHKYYLSVIVSSPDQDALKQFAGLVESKVRILVRNIEDEQHDVISLARPYTKGFKRVHKVETAEQAAEVKKGSMQYKIEETTTTETTDPQLVTDNGTGTSAAENGNVTAPESAGSHKLFTQTFYIGLDLTEKAVRNLNLVSPIQNFKHTCWQWDGYKPDVHDLVIEPCKSYQLPDDVFSEGELKPTKPVKKGKKKASADAPGTVVNGSGKKRPAAEMADPATETGGNKRLAMTNGHGTPTPKATPTPTPV